MLARRGLHHRPTGKADLRELQCVQFRAWQARLPRRLLAFSGRLFRNLLRHRQRRKVQSQRPNAPTLARRRVARRVVQSVRRQRKPYQTRSTARILQSHSPCHGPGRLAPCLAGAFTASTQPPSSVSRDFARLSLPANRLSGRLHRLPAGDRRLGQSGLGSSHPLQAYAPKVPVRDERRVVATGFRGGLRSRPCSQRERALAYGAEAPQHVHSHITPSPPCRARYGIPLRARATPLRSTKSPSGIREEPCGAGLAVGPVRTGVEAPRGRNLGCRDRGGWRQGRLAGRSDAVACRGPSPVQAVDRRHRVSDIG